MTVNFILSNRKPLQYTDIKIHSTSHIKQKHATWYKKNKLVKQVNDHMYGYSSKLFLTDFLNKRNEVQRLMLKDTAFQKDNALKPEVFYP